MRIFNVILVGPANYKETIMIGQTRGKAIDIANALNRKHSETLRENHMEYVAREEFN
jgi:hypothetical protein